jgi:hypothetical protein
VIARLDVVQGTSNGCGVRVRVSRRAASDLLVALGPFLPFADASIDEIRLGRSLAHVDDLVSTMAEIWRISKAGALVHARMPHASSPWAAGREPAPVQSYTIEAFRYFSPDRQTDVSGTPFEIERCRLHLKRSEPTAGISAKQRSPFVRAVEALANRDKGMQYRWERWLGPMIGGFEEFSIVLSAVKAAPIG